MNKDSTFGHNIIIAVLVVLVIVLALFDIRLFRENREVDGSNTTAANTDIVSNDATRVTNSSTNAATNNTSNTTTNSTSDSSSDQQKGTPKVVSSSPSDNEAISENAPVSVSVTFDTALDASSTLSVTRNIYPQRVGTSKTTFSNDKKTMTLSVNVNESDAYTIHYTACVGQNIDCTTDSLTFVFSDPLDSRSPGKAQ